MCTFYRGTIESILTSCVTVWYGACNASCRKSLQRIVRAAEKIVGHLQHPSHPQSPLNCRWSHPPDTQLLQSGVIREETAESPGQDQQTEGQLHPSGCQEAKRPCPPSPLWMYKLLVFGDEFLAQDLHLKSHQRCSAGIRTWLSADQSSSSTLTESSFLFDPCLIHRDTVMLE